LALAVGGFLVVVLPLVPDLYAAIPWPFRKGLGWVVFAAVIGLGLERLWQVRPGDDAPPRDEPPPARWAGFVAPLAIGALAVPFLGYRANIGAGDWDVDLQWYEAIRRTIREWCQFPWWNPWCRGGFPLAANPQVGAVGIATPLVLVMGTSVGLRVATLASVLIATEGARRVARLWLREPMAAAVAGLIYGINGAALVQVVAGYHMAMSYLFFPWMLYYTTRLDRRPADGAWLGAWAALDVLNGISYCSVYAPLICGVVWLRAARARGGTARLRLLAHTALAAGVALALSGWRLATTVFVFRDFPRHLRSIWDETPWTILRNLLTRPSSSIATEEGVYYWDASCYIGPVVLVLAAASLTWGWRWWHTLAAVCGGLAVGSVWWYHPSYWLADLPLFSSMHMVGRWRIMALFGVGLAAADVLARWRLGASRGRRRLAAVLAVAIAADFVVLGFQILPYVYRLAPDESRFPGPRVQDVIQVGDGMKFPATSRGYGVIHMPEPLLGYDQRAETARLWRGHRDYIGESWTDAGPVRPEFWSPNRIVFRVAPGQAVYLNQNPGSWWLANGRPAFPGRRCAETREVFMARADADGRLVLEIRPPGLGLGLGLHLAGFALIASTLVGARWIERSGLAHGLPARRSDGGEAWRHSPGGTVQCGGGFERARPDGPGSSR
jgi:hypothetical protein